MEDLFRIVLTLVVIGLIAWAVALIVARFVGRVTIREYQRGLRFEAGKFVGLLDAGTHMWFRTTSDALVVDARPSSTAIDGQEVLTADGVAVNVTTVPTR